MATWLYGPRCCWCYYCRLCPSLPRPGIASLITLVVWWFGVVVSMLVSISEVNLRRSRLVLRWATMSRFNSRCRTFISVCNQPATQVNSAFHPSGVGKWVPALAGKEKAGMVHSVSRWMWGVQVKLWDPSRTCAIPERLRGVFTTRRYTNPSLTFTFIFS